MPILPTTIEARVVAKLYRDAELKNWAHGGPSSHNRQYRAWLDDPEVGGILAGFMKRDDARVWIKDGPMKEYARARAGVGRYKVHIANQHSAAARVASAALTRGWSVVPGSQRIKPLSCIVENGDERKRLFWGPSKDFKHLLWAALLHHASGATESAHLAVVESVGHQVDAALRRQHQTMANRYDFGISHVRIE